MFPDLMRDDVFRLETKRLWLRWPRVSDVGAITAYASLREVAEMTANVPHPYPAGAAEAYILRNRQSNAAGTAFGLVMTLKTGQREVFGSMGIYGGATRLALGYMLHPDCWGKGYASEAVSAILAAVFAYSDAAEIEADVRVSNPASRRVLDKAGFVFNGVRMAQGAARSEPYELESSALTRADWEKRHGLRSLGLTAAGAPA